MVILAAKHYIAKDMCGNPYSKGVSYVRRTGMAISNMSAKEFSHIFLSPLKQQQLIKSLAKKYSCLVNEIKFGSTRDIYKSRLAKNAITWNYIRVLATRGLREARYTAFNTEDDDESEALIDTIFYISAIRRSLRAVCKSIGLEDETYIVRLSPGQNICQTK